ncbi:DUF2892 domain-containing protein [bacterium]|nr:MAG: DUF2892 domain-containing protein [bacterium]
MKKNLGLLDRFLRFAFAVIVSLLYFTNTISGLFGTILLILASVLLITSFISFCPIYALFGISSCKLDSDK